MGHDLWNVHALHWMILMGLNDRNFAQSLTWSGWQFLTCVFLFNHYTFLAPVKDLNGNVPSRKRQNIMIKTHCISVCDVTKNDLLPRYFQVWQSDCPSHWTFPDYWFIIYIAYWTSVNMISPVLGPQCQVVALQALPFCVALWVMVFSGTFLHDNYSLVLRAMASIPQRNNCFQRVSTVRMLKIYASLLLHC